MGAGRVVALPDANGDGIADEVITIAGDLDRPSSLAFHGGWLYIGETGQIRRIRLGPGFRPLELQIVVPGLPTEGFHVTRTVLVGPSAELYVSVGSSCDVCVEEDPRRAAIWVYPLEGGPGRPFATGLRNAVGLAPQPETDALWASNNSRDWLGDDQPQDGIYLLTDGTDYGWPRCHNGSLLDPEFGERGDCAGVPVPAVGVQAHSAPLGLAFYDGQQFPEEYRGDLFVAFHGSWNRSVPTGYKVVRLPFEGDEPTGQVLDFATGWLQDDGQTAPGRPVGLIVAPDGSLMVSDDRAGLVYRLVYTGQASP
jgi:glucose/arabinose dehydrogenase